MPSSRSTLPQFQGFWTRESDVHTENWRVCGRIGFSGSKLKNLPKERKTLHTTVGFAEHFQSQNRAATGLLKLCGDDQQIPVP